jgi:dTDP-4-dehydrorhamnose reductase
MLLTGRQGQLGWELERALSPLGEVAAADHASLDLGNPDVVTARVRSLAPDVIVNAAAYTAVDQAETEPDRAFAVNARGPAVLAEEAKRLDALLIHYSTDYVFDGTKAGPYTEDDVPNPLGVYGQSKLEGERAIQASGCRHLILRTCWVYGARGRNFLLTMLRLASERPELRVVDDQVGSPTWCRVIAQVTAELLARGRDAPPLMHLACAGYASWFEFACTIMRHTAGSRARQPRVVAIASSAYPTAARRPANSRLSTARLEGVLGRALPQWEESLKRCLAELA